MQRYLVRFSDETIIKGFDTKEEVQSYLMERTVENREDNAEEYGMPMDDIDDIEDIDKMDTEGVYIYRIKELLQEVKKSSMDEDEKNRLYRQLRKDEICIDIEDFIDFDEILDDIDGYDIF
ncbi:hypothetical protein SIM13_20085 [Bacillus cereus group sp. BfR-BA-01233]|uniref:hypothetical protein n=1 Tax=Bacillus cereus group sp. BfR-BA-01233 TaxID=3094879 RepID=UPI000C28E6EF|nr:hypothetical protein [Bacillus cereus group sp. BfR-BA-01233]MDX5845330.1 hypothetical protein [Bacillus cereus group sp. BfR-BA-01233]